MPLFSNSDQLIRVSELACNFLRLPFSGTSVPGNLLEALVEEVRGGDTQRLNTYDFVDVVSRSEKIGWQVKSTDAKTPVTWIRGKLPGKEALIDASHTSEGAKQLLGDAIIDYCNAHVVDSIRKYQLERIGYIRLINFGGRFRYFERALVDAENPMLFNPADYVWNWSVPKNTTKKEQLPAFHGVHAATGVKHFAWHGKGENQLHFTAERLWWPPDHDPHTIAFSAPASSDKVSLEVLAHWLEALPDA